MLLYTFLKTSQYNFYDVSRLTFPISSASPLTVLSWMVYAYKYWYTRNLWLWRSTVDEVIYTYLRRWSAFHSHRATRCYKTNILKYPVRFYYMLIMRTFIHGSSCAPVILIFTIVTIGANYTDINLPHDHIKYYFNSFPTAAEKCRNDTACPYKVRLVFNFDFL